MVKIAQDWGSERVTWLTLTLANQLLGADTPAHIFDQLLPTSVEPWIIEEAKAQFLGHKVRRTPMTPDLADFATENKLINRFKIALSRVFLPKLTLARLYNVPPTSFRIYGCYFKRFFTLIRNYGKSVSQLIRKDQSVEFEIEKENNIIRLKKGLGKISADN